MTPALVAARAGLSRGRIEFKQTLTTPGDLIAILVTTGSLLAVMIWTRHTTVPGMRFSLGTTTLVSVLGLDVVVYGFITTGDLLVTEREDGTLLRAKAIPNGMLGYLLGKVVNISGQIAFVVAITLLAGAFLFTGLAIGSAGSWPGCSCSGCSPRCRWAPCSGRCFPASAAPGGRCCCCSAG